MGPHVHTQWMGNCPKGDRQSVAPRFVEIGVPVTGQNVTSQSCPSSDARFVRTCCAADRS